MILAHSFVGYPLTYLILKFFPEIKKFSKKQIDFLYLTGVVSAVLPDFDILYSILFHDSNHRYFITHSFFPYLLIFFMLNLFSYKYKKFQTYLFILSLVFLAGVVSHLIIDFYVGGIVLLAPFSFTLYGYEIVFQNTGFWNNYFTSFYLISELLVMLPFFAVILYQKFQKTPINYLGAKLSVILLLVSCIMALYFLIR